MKKLKKIIILCIIIFLILLLALITVKYFESRNYIKRLLDRGCENINYSYSYENELKVYIKGNIEKSIYSNGNILYSNYETGEKIFIDIENKQINLLNQKEKYLGPQKSKYAKDIEEKEYDFKGKEIIKENISCYVIDLYKENNNNSNYLITRIWINKELGTIEKIAYYNVKKSGAELLSETEYNMHTGEVTDVDIARPNLDDYKEFEIIQN